MKRFTFASLLTFFLLSLPLFSHAAIGPSGDPSEILSTSISPQFPKPGDLVTISIESFSFDLNSSVISWSHNGKVTSTGTGKKQFSFNAGPLGAPSTITVTVAPQSGAPFKNDIVITPSNLDIIWEAQTYTPPFYQGKALFTGQSNVVVTAIPQLGGINNSPESNLVYRWTINDYVLNDQSGYGRQSVTLIGNYWGRDEKISVSVSSPNGIFTAEKTFTLRPKNPQVFVYEDNPLLGVLMNHAVSGVFSLDRDSEVSFFAAPFFFKSNLLSGANTAFTWKMNDKVVSGGENGNTVTFRNDSGQTGSSLVGIQVQQPSVNFQNGSANFSIQFK